MSEEKKELETSAKASDRNTIAEQNEAENAKKKAEDEAVALAAGAAADNEEPVEKIEPKKGKKDEKDEKNKNQPEQKKPEDKKDATETASKDASFGSSMMASVESNLEMVRSINKPITEATIKGIKKGAELAYDKSKELHEYTREHNPKYAEFLDKGAQKYDNIKEKYEEFKETVKTGAKALGEKAVEKVKNLGSKEADEKTSPEVSQSASTEKTFVPKSSRRANPSEDEGIEMTPISSMSSPKSTVTADIEMDSNADSYNNAASSTGATKAEPAAPSVVSGVELGKPVPK